MTTTTMFGEQYYHQYLKQQERLIPDDRLCHPLRKRLTEEDYLRLYRIALGVSQEECSQTEIDAFEDFLFDRMAAEQQTAPTIAYLQ